MSRLRGVIEDAVASAVERLTDSRRAAMDAAVLRARAELPEPITYDVHQLAAATGFTRKTLEHWRTAGGGPPFVKVGRHVRYLKSDVEAWLASLRVENTAQEARPR